MGLGVLGRLCVVVCHDLFVLLYVGYLLCMSSLRSYFFSRGILCYH